MRPATIVIAFLASGLVFAFPAAAAPRSWSLTAVGDIMLDRDVRAVIDRQGLAAIITPVRPLLKGNVVVGNLEGPFTRNRSVAGNTYLRFTFDPKWAPVLRQSGFTSLSLANNHTLNFGQAGLTSTREILRDANLRYFGDPNNFGGRSIIHRLNGTRVALVGYHGLVPGLDGVIREIKIVHARADVVIVFPHWGAEYQLGFQPRLQREARMLIDAGADMVLGGHPHVVEPMEIYKGKFIAYSLGNFLFDQYWSTETQRGLLVRLNALEKKVTIRLYPLTMRRGLVSPAPAAVRSAMLNRLADTSQVSAAQRDGIRRGLIRVSLK